jgi:nucleotide-binding universal stress UspA family protein
MNTDLKDRADARADHARFRLKNVLNPTDFSGEADHSFVHAVRLSLAMKGQLTVIHVARDVTSAGHEWDHFPKVRKLLEKWGFLDSGVAEEDVYANVGTHVMKADLGYPEPAHGVAKYVEHHPSDLIVMGTHSREGMELWFSGSIASDLAREAKLPALIVPNQARGFVDPETGQVRLKNILIPVDSHPDPKNAVVLVRAIAALLEVPEPVLHLLHVGEAMPNIETGSAKTEQLLRGGSPIDVILSTADEVGADLIVMATEGRHGFLDIVRGSTSEQVLHKARVPILTVPAEA